MFPSDDAPVFCRWKFIPQLQIASRRRWKFLFWHNFPLFYGMRKIFSNYANWLIPNNNSKKFSSFGWSSFLDGGWGLCDRTKLLKTVAIILMHFFHCWICEFCNRFLFGRMTCEARKKCNFVSLSNICAWTSVAGKVFAVQKRSLQLLRKSLASGQNYAIVFYFGR